MENNSARLYSLSVRFFSLYFLLDFFPIFYLLLLSSRVFWLQKFFLENWKCKICKWKWLKFILENCLLSIVKLSHLKVIKLRMECFGSFWAFSCCQRMPTIITNTTFRFDKQTKLTKLFENCVLYVYQCFSLFSYLNWKTIFWYFIFKYLHSSTVHIDSIQKLMMDLIDYSTICWNNIWISKNYSLSG